ncbi:hypothetical protein HRR83_005941 [Exophiala dermatitidis]|uniref:Increased recombination centers protein 6 n=2 Tax=Exophiala dermatitidis TaxID=5970 RepID=H6BNM8_EXODN|nr:uncharacterized protein HMPREF1120_01410 [Exophiala dermatitidis NIH/UT8656]KAJ4505082.1 hypothetical protein HRR75_007417 [Exophiala dermatitidis]EHY53213.1 hypothetical protein HMPREF1120_01410 [Exophiala dermatitidis NIH/UT8656]KAJ4507162.1 hypothetical protein HRR74_008085 [Exophiala dermatitidis]KAJ4517364.1 hypothetical protein HRR73_004416 [Exophiala dermatitidis]KAJ4548888.1 hypothetical protein HRR76_001465 [Exophiala dermatitidis]
MPISQALPSSLRLLILAPTSEPASIPPLPGLLEALTGSKPSDHVPSFTGYTSHPPLELRTKYYNSDVNIWCDEVPTRTISQERDPENQSTAGSQASTGEGEVTPKAPVPDQDDRHDTDTPAPSSLDEWKQQMLSAEAAEVRAVIGGIVLVLPVSPPMTSSSATGRPTLPPAYYSLIEAVHGLRETIEEETYGRDIASVVVLQSTSPSVSQDKLAGVAAGVEDECLSERGILGWDFVAWNGVSTVHSTTADDGSPKNVRNEYGEKVGIERVIEVLEGVDWTVVPDHPDDGEENGKDFDFDDFGRTVADNDPSASNSGLRSILGSGRFSGLEYELEREMMELKMSMLDDHDHGQEPDGDADADSETRPTTTDADAPRVEVDQDEEFQVEQLQAMMERVVAIREAGSELSKTERERFARREIAKLMRDMS